VTKPHTNLDESLYKIEVGCMSSAWKSLLYTYINRLYSWHKCWALYNRIFIFWVLPEETRFFMTSHTFKGERSWTN